MTTTSANEIRQVEWITVTDDDPDPSYLEQDFFADRKARYDRGDFWFIGVRAVAEIVVNDTIQTIQTPGLWGIESDSGDEYLREVAGEEMQQLAEILRELGFDVALSDERFVVELP